MISQPAIKPTVILPDAAPLIDLAAGEALSILIAMGRVVVVDVVAMKAASLLGNGATVADVIVMLHLAGLPPPLPPVVQQRAELTHARWVLGLQQLPANEGSLAGGGDGR